MMKSGNFDFASWDGPRVPDPDPLLDEDRRRLYWEWMEVASLGPDDAPRFDKGSDGRDWVRIDTGAQADYEARFMRHSVGHSFDHYGSLGPIYSLREDGNVPSVTILVSKGVVVHARRAENAPLTNLDMTELTRLADIHGWSVLPPDRL